MAIPEKVALIHGARERLPGSQTRTVIVLIHEADEAYGPTWDPSSLRVHSADFWNSIAQSQVEYVLAGFEEAMRQVMRATERLSKDITGPLASTMRVTTEMIHADVWTASRAFRDVTAVTAADLAAWNSIKDIPQLVSGKVSTRTTTSTQTATETATIQQRRRRERLSRLSSERRELFERIVALRDETAPVDLDVSAALAEIREDT